MSKKKLWSFLLAFVLVIGAVIVWVAGPSNAAPSTPMHKYPYSTTVTWYKDGGTLDNIWPQNLTEISCGGIKQTDDYTITGYVRDQQFRALLAGGVLNGPADDAAFYPHNYSVVLLPACATDTTSPEPTPTETTPEPTPSTTEVEPTPTDSTATPAPVTSLHSTPPVPSTTVTTATPAPVTSLHTKPTQSQHVNVVKHQIKTSPVAKVVTKQAALANTGVKTSTMIWLAVFLLIGGAGLMAATRHKGTHRR